MKTILINDSIKLKKYRSIYKNTLFKTNSKEKQMKLAITALNIKNKKERIDYIYDATCNYIDEFYTCNICNFKKGYCLKNFKNGCCRYCKYSSNKGCTSKNISCKLFFCEDVAKNNKIIGFDDLYILDLLTIKQKKILKHCFFYSREEILKELYLNSFIIFSFRSVYRIIKNLNIKKLINDKRKR